MYFFHWAYIFVIVFILLFANTYFSFFLCLGYGRHTVFAEKEAELLYGYAVGLPSSQTLLDTLIHLNSLQLT